MSLFSSAGRSLAFLSTELPCLIFNRDSSRFFWAKKTSLYNHRPIKPGHCQGKPMVFKNNKTVKRWLKNSGPAIPSYLQIRTKKSFDAMFEYEEGRKRLMHRLMRGDKKIAEF